MTWSIGAWRSLFPDASRETIVYDKVGNRTEFANPGGITTTTYSQRNEPLSVTDQNNQVVTYQYDALSQQQVMTDADGGLFTNTYDAVGRLSGLVNPQNETTTITYDGQGQITNQINAAGVTTVNTYNAASWLTGRENRRTDNSLVTRLTYAYDQVGNRTAELQLDGTITTWSYDSTNQLNRERRT